jgi:hypothetical protein
MENEQFRILPKYILEVAELIMDLQLRHSIGSDYDWVLVDVRYDPNDEEQSKAIERMMDIDDE